MEFKNVRYEYVKKVPLGYKEAGEQDATHVLMDIVSWNNMLDETIEWEEECKDRMQELESKLKNEKQSNSRLLDSITEQHKEAETKMNSAVQMMDKAEKLKQEAEKVRNEQRVEIENIRRIYKETINAARGLKPKKSHTGYCVVSSTQKEYTYKGRYGSMERVILWETILETPYVVDFTSEEVEKNIKELTKKREDGSWLIGEIGISGHYGDNKWTETKIRKWDLETYEVEHEQLGKYEEMIESDDFKDCHEKYNVMLRHQLKANYRTGFWEMIFYHTKTLGVVPQKWRRNTYS